MKQLKKKVSVLLTLAMVATLGFGCSSNTTSSTQTEENTTASTTVTIGVTGGPHETIMQKVSELAADEGLDIKIVTFSDFIQPNTQLAEGALDMNSMQHAPFLEKTIADKGYTLSNIGNSILIPMCILSEKYDTLESLPDNSVVGLPNDTTNLARALILLQSAGLIELTPGADASAELSDIISNPKNLSFTELEAGMLLRALPDLDFAVVNSNYVVEAGLVPADESLFVEPTTDNPWVNIFACRTGEEDTPAFQQLITIYQSDEIKEFIDSTYRGAVLAAW